MIFRTSGVLAAILIVFTEVFKQLATLSVKSTKQMANAYTFLNQNVKQIIFYDFSMPIQ